MSGRTRTPALLAGSFALLCIGGWPSPGAAPGSASSVVPRAGYTERDLARDSLKFARRTMVEAYRQFGKRDPRWNDAAIRYAEANARVFSGQEDIPSNEQLIADGKALLEAGCADPLVVYCYAAALQEHGALPEAEALMRRAVDGFATSQYPKARGFFAPLRLAQICQARGLPSAREVDRSVRLAIDWIGEAAGEESVRDGGQRMLLAAIDDRWRDLFGGHWREIYDAVLRNPKADPYVVAVLGARCNKDEGWQARGTGWASEVTPEGWKGFGEHLVKARELYLQAWKLHPDFPEAPAGMIVLSMADYGVAGSSVYTWFSRAISAQVDYQPAYDYLLRALLPRWGGSRLQMLSVGVSCAESGRYDTAIPLVFVRALSMLTDDMGGDKAYWTRRDTYDRLKRVFAGYARADRSERQRHLHRALWAECAWYMGHYDDARKAFAAAGEGPLPAAPTQWNLGQDPETMRDEAYGLSGPGGAKALRAEALLQQGRPWEARQAYQTLLRRADNAYAARYYRGRLAAADFDDRLARGEWVSLQPDGKFTGWIRQRGSWEIEPDGAIQGTSSERGMWLLCQRDFGHRVELRGEVEFVSFDGPSNADGVVLVDVSGQATDGYIAFGMHRHGQITIVSTNIGKAQGPTVEAPVGDHDTFRVTLWDGVVNTYLNDRPLHRGADTGRKSGPAPEGIGVGSSYGRPGSVVRFRNLQLRRLTERPQA